MTTDYVQAPFGIFELRAGRPPVLHSNGRRKLYGDGSDGSHDYTTEEVRCWAQSAGNWKFISEQEARELLTPTEGE